MDRQYYCPELVERDRLSVKEKGNPSAWMERQQKAKLRPKYITLYVIFRKKE